MSKSLNNRQIEYEIGKEEAGIRLSRFLKDRGYPEASLSRLRHEEGATLFNNVPVHMNYVFRNEDCGVLKVIIRDSGISGKIEPVFGEIDIIYEDEDIIVINKPAFMPIHPSLNNYGNTLANALAYYMAQKGEHIVFRCINRLDRDTTGLTIVAKHYLAAGILSEAMNRREIKREYFGIAEKVDITNGTIDAPIARKNDSSIERTVDYEKGETAVTHYETLLCKNELSLYRFKLDTGRTHQIRVHMKYLGSPLIGDFLYNPEDKRMTRQALHAGKLSFCHPITGKEMIFAAQLPEDMREYFDFVI